MTKDPVLAIQLSELRSTVEECASIPDGRDSHSRRERLVSEIVDLIVRIGGDDRRILKELFPCRDRIGAKESVRREVFAALDAIPRTLSPGEARSYFWAAEFAHDKGRYRLHTWRIAMAVSVFPFFALLYALAPSSATLNALGVFAMVTGGFGAIPVMMVGVFWLGVLVWFSLAVSAFLVLEIEILARAVLDRPVVAAPADWGPLPIGPHDHRPRPPLPLTP